MAARDTSADAVDELRSQLAVALAKRPVSEPTYHRREAKQRLARLIKDMAPELREAFGLVVQLMGES